MLTVLIPWRPQPSRLAAFDAVAAWYHRNVPDVTIRPVDCDDEIFNLAQCRNRAIDSVADENEVVVINDADTIPEERPLRDAINAAASSGLVHLPYTEYRWLGPAGTEELNSGTALRDCSFDLVSGACSGVYVTTLRTWRRHGGQDERFRGWGFEDAAWYLAHETLLGSAPLRTTGRVYALHHEAQDRHGPQYDANAALMDDYRDAASDPAAMRDLVIASNARSLPGA